MSGDATAPEGCRYVCACCGKTSSTRYGFDGTADPGWDSSCMSNAVLCAPAADPENPVKWREVVGPLAS